MAYVRVRGNQLAIVHGVREPGTGKVQQQILFTIYSKPEALAIADSGVSGPGYRFRAFWKQKYPDIKLDWKTVGRAIAEHASVLPDHYGYGPERLRGQFREDLCRFARQLMLTDPQDLSTSAQVIQEHRFELEYIANLITWRVKLRDREQSKWTTDDEFCWRYALRGWGHDVPPEIEEEAVGFYDRGDHERAAPIFQLLVDCFDRYADGHNYLGLIALARSDFSTAISRFEKTVELGRKLFPARIGKKRYWADHDTRPYMRGLRNLTLALVEAGRFDEALRICDRLEHECGDIESASWHRATIGLNTRDWKPASEGEAFMELDAARGFLIAFAEYERGRIDRVVPAFVHAALQFPRAARMLADKTMAMCEPRSYDDSQDHNTGVSLWRAIHAYRRKQSRRAKQFFRTLARDPQLTRVLDEVIELRLARSNERGREAFDKLRHIQSSELARALAIQLLARAESSERDHSELVN
jgi:tetratricopeptide (TPR) repeat protein